MKEITSFNFTDEIEKFEGVVLVDFWAPWCAPCRMVTPVLKELEKDYSDNKKVKIVKINTDNEKNLSKRFSIRGIPTVKVFKEGSEVDQFVGAAPKETYKSLIDKNL